MPRPSMTSRFSNGMAATWARCSAARVAPPDTRLFSTSAPRASHAAASSLGNGMEHSYRSSRTIATPSGPRPFPATTNPARL
jgi:hypothetical protein